MKFLGRKLLSFALCISLVATSSAPCGASAPTYTTNARVVPLSGQIVTTTFEGIGDHLMALLGQRKASDFSVSELRLFNDSYRGQVTEALSAYSEPSSPFLIIGFEANADKDSRGFHGLLRDINKVNEVIQQIPVSGRAKNKIELRETLFRTTTSLFVVQQLAANGFEELATAELETHFKHLIHLFYLLSYRNNVEISNFLRIFNQEIYALLQSRAGVYWTAQEQARTKRLHQQMLTYFENDERYRAILKAEVKEWRGRHRSLWATLAALGAGGGVLAMTMGAYLVGAHMLGIEHFRNETLSQGLLMALSVAALIAFPSGAALIGTLYSLNGRDIVSRVTKVLKAHIEAVKSCDLLLRGQS